MKTNQPDIELNELFDGKLKIYQKKHGYRFSIDAILLGSFAVEHASGTVVDLGTGSGILPIILARYQRFKKIIGIEIQKDLAALAEQNVLLNKCEGIETIVHTDIKEIKTRFSPGKFDVVITNPPFYPAGTGRINPGKQNAIARHELYGTLQDFISVAAFLLTQSGKFIAVYRSSRIVDLIAELRKKNIEPKAFQFVHARIDAPATMVLLAGIKGAGVETKTLPPLILYTACGDYTEGVKAVFKRI